VQRVLVLNGPNLNRLGSREPEVYGSTTYPELVNLCQAWAGQVNLSADVRQSNDESTIVGWLHEAADDLLPVVLNPAAFTHYSYALRDACAMVASPIVEVHISNPAAREEFRHSSVISAVVQGTIAGFGIDSYRLALNAIAQLIRT
jgi:3-dehydroquinate dehydratase-2